MCIVYVYGDCASKMTKDAFFFTFVEDHWKVPDVAVVVDAAVVAVASAEAYVAVDLGVLAVLDWQGWHSFVTRQVIHCFLPCLHFVD